MHAVITYDPAFSESRAMRAIFDACRANPKREAKCIDGLRVEFSSVVSGHAAVCYCATSGEKLASALVDEFDI